ncbi:MAG: hypothetical protein BWY93_01963 [Euryarchaeota archaeon ADurb.BinA087]|nr:MAG: hypothetical protein BWY93_01963 [Euryarchaeota archaeon ADurb.BinA087]
MNKFKKFFPVKILIYDPIILQCCLVYKQYPEILVETPDQFGLILNDSTELCFTKCKAVLKLLFFGNVLKNKR